MTPTENLNSKAARSLVLDTEQKAVIVAFHKQTLLPWVIVSTRYKPPFHI